MPTMVAGRPPHVTPPPGGTVDDVVLVDEDEVVVGPTVVLVEELVVVGPTVVLVDEEVVVGAAVVLVDEEVVVGAAVVLVDEEVVVGATEVVVVEEVDVVVDGGLVAGCQLGSLSMAGTAVGRRVTSLPSGFATKMSGPLGAPNALEEKVIFVPSGDQAGNTAFGATRCWLPPSASMIQTAEPLP